MNTCWILSRYCTCAQSFNFSSCSVRVFDLWWFISSTSVSSGRAGGSDGWSDLPPHRLSGQTPRQHPESQGEEDVCLSQSGCLEQVEIFFWSHTEFGNIWKLIACVCSGDGHGVEEGGGESGGAGTRLPERPAAARTDTHLQTRPEHLQGSGYSTHTSVLLPLRHNPFPRPRTSPWNYVLMLLWKRSVNAQTLKTNQVILWIFRKRWLEVLLCCL